MSLVFRLKPLDQAGGNDFSLNSHKKTTSWTNAKLAANLLVANARVYVEMLPQHFCIGFFRPYTPPLFLRRREHVMNHTIF